MATAPIANVDSMGNFTSLLNLFKGSGTTTSSTSSNISSQGINAILQQALGSAQGLSAVAGGQRSAGLYNSSTNQLLIDDLLTRTSGELAKQQAGTTTRQKTGAQFNPTSLLGILAAQKLLGPSLKTLADKTGINGIGDKINSAIFGDGGSADVGSGAVSTESALGPYEGGAALDSAASSTAVDIGSTAALTGIDGAAIAGGGADVAGLTALDSAAASDVGGAAIAAGAGEAAAGAGAADVAGLAAADSAASSGILDGLVAAAPEAAAAWVICTELNRQGLLNDQLYEASAQRALQLSQEVMSGYHWWAIPTTRAVRKYKYLAKFFSYLANSRCEYLLGTFRIWGWLSVVVGEPICGFLGSHLTSQPNWKELYGGH